MRRHDHPPANCCCCCCFPPQRHVRELAQAGPDGACSLRGSQVQGAGCRGGGARRALASERRPSFACHPPHPRWQPGTELFLAARGAARHACIRRWLSWGSLQPDSPSRLFASRPVGITAGSAQGGLRRPWLCWERRFCRIRGPYPAAATHAGAAVAGTIIVGSFPRVASGGQVGCWWWRWCYRCCHSWCHFWYWCWCWEGGTFDPHAIPSSVGALCLVRIHFTLSLCSDRRLPSWLCGQLHQQLDTGRPPESLGADLRRE